MSAGLEGTERGRGRIRNGLDHTNQLWSEPIMSIPWPRMPIATMRKLACLCFAMIHLYVRQYRAVGIVIRLFLWTKHF